MTVLALSAVLAVGACSPASTATLGATVTSGATQTATSSPSSTDPGAAVYSAIETQVRELRGLPAKTSVPRSVIDRDAAIARITADFDRTEPAAALATRARLLQQMGLLPAGASLRDLYLSLVGSQILGFYDPEAKSMYVVSSAAVPGPLEKATYAHEYTHALQDQSFDLEKLLGEFVLSDESLANLSLIEGDATLLMTLWMTKHLTADELSQAAAEGSSSPQTAVLNAAPAVLRETLLFPYSKGASFVNELWRSGGWKAVDAVYAHPPTSTAQIIHPELYTSGWKPATVTMPPTLASELGSGWKIALEETVGEATTATWLGANGVTSAEATTAAAGWRGDRIVLLEGPSNAVAVAWVSDWTTATDASELVTAAEKVVGSGKLPGFVMQPTTTRTLIVLSPDRPTIAKIAAPFGLMPSW